MQPKTSDKDFFEKRQNSTMSIVQYTIYMPKKEIPVFFSGNSDKTHLKNINYKVE